MAVGVNSVAQFAVAEAGAEPLCLLEPSAFNIQDRLDAVYLYRDLGEQACYRQSGVQKIIYVFVDRELQDLDGSPDTTLALTRYRITLQKIDINQPRRGDDIITLDGKYQVETVEQDDDPVEWAVSARRVA